MKGKYCKCGKEATVSMASAKESRINIFRFCRECYKEWMDEYRLKYPLSKENIESRKPPPLF